MMPSRDRLKLYALFGAVCYVFAGLTISDVGPTTLFARDPSAECTAPVQGGGADDAGLTILQGNLWMLPVRPLLVPFRFATDRHARLERLIEAVHTCRPTIVLLQEVFEGSVVDILERHLPEYRVVTSGEVDLTGTLNTSGLVTLTRLPVEDARFQPFARIPLGHTTYEVMARKGILAVDVVGDGFEATVLNVHLYGSRHPAAAPLRRDEQLREVLDLVAALEASGRRVLVGGDFNIPRDQLASRLPDGWEMSQHGPTYDPANNRYAVQGANDNATNREKQRTGAADAIDFLLSPPSAGIRLSSQVLELVVSDHQFIHHTVWTGAE